MSVTADHIREKLTKDLGAVHVVGDLLLQQMNKLLLSTMIFKYITYYSPL